MPETKDFSNTPKFKKPPLIETAMGVQFNELDSFRITHFGLFWELINRDKKYPKVAELAPLQGTIERNESPSAGGLFQSIFNDPISLPRVWYSSEKSAAGETLIQLQTDKLLQNWRRANLHNEEYSSFQENASDFQKVYKEFLRFCDNNKIGNIEPNQCEITYVNRIPVDGNLVQTIRELIPDLANFGKDDLTKSNPDNLQFKISYWVDDLSGRIHVSMAPAVIKGKNEPVIDLRITARGTPVDSSLEGVLNWLQMGHYYVVTKFTNFTSEQFHKKWERTR